MLLTGTFGARRGPRPIIIGSGLALAALLPFLAVAPTPLTLGCALTLFGAALGSLDVAMNLHAVEIERGGPPLMSGFHALFSAGGLGGAALTAAMLSAGASPLAAACLDTLVAAASILFAWPNLLRGAPAPQTREAAGPGFARPHGATTILALLAGALFLVEGALLDWGALLIVGAGLLPEAQGGLGYAVFSVAMAAGRFSGDAASARLGDRALLVASGGTALAGFATLLAAGTAAIALAGFLLIGLGCANIVPIVFRRAGARPDPGLAIAAVTTVGYAGVLIGPALVGFAAQATSLPVAFVGLAALVALAPLLSRAATAERS